MGKLLRWGMVGGGMDAFIGEVHRKAMALDPRVDFVAGCFSHSPEKNDAVGEAYSLDPDRVYAEYGEMAKKEAAREDGIDLVSITTPNDTHYEIAKAFLEQGIHVVCEKPLCFEVREAEELAALARERDLIFAVTYTYTGYAMSKVMREMIAKGRIGKIAAVSAEYIQDWLLDELTPGIRENPSVWRLDPRHSGISNCVGDIGTHIENYVHYVTGLKIRRLCATANRFGRPLELNANMLVEFEGGVNGAYWCSQIAAGRLNGLCVRIYGDQGALEWEQQNPDELRFTPKGQATQTLSRGCGYLGEEAGALSRIPAGHPEGLMIAFANIYRNVVSTIIKKKRGEVPDEKERDFPTIEDGLNGVKFIRAVIDSAANGSCWVHL